MDKSLQTVKFGRIPSPYDERDFRLVDFMPGPFVRALTAPLSTTKSWIFPREALNQGTTPHCVGFSMADFGICEPTFDMYTTKDGHHFYELCKQIDGYKGDGSTVRAAAKVLKNLGRIPAYAFASTVEEIKWWLLNKSPVIMGTIWTQGMVSPDAGGVIRATGNVLGGHAYLLNGWDGTHFLGVNSWGPYWGVNGKFKISQADLERIFRQGGEAMTAVEVDTPDGKTPPPAPQPEPKPEPGYKKRNKSKK